MKHSIFSTENFKRELKSIAQCKRTKGNGEHPAERLIYLGWIIKNYNLYWECCSISVSKMGERALCSLGKHLWLKPSDHNHFLKQAICQLAVFFLRQST